MYSVASDGGGGVVAAGYFTDTATFGDVVLRGVGNRDALLWKVSELGTTLWAHGGGGADADELYGVAVDGSRGVVVAGPCTSRIRVTHSAWKRLVTQPLM